MLAAGLAPGGRRLRWAAGRRPISQAAPPRAAGSLLESGARLCSRLRCSPYLNHALSGISVRWFRAENLCAAGGGEIPTFRKYDDGIAHDPRLQRRNWRPH